MANFFIFRPQPVRHRITVLTHQHESQTQYNFPFSIRGDDPAAQFMRDHHVGHIPNTNRDTVDRGDDNPGNLIDIDRPPHTLNQYGIAGLLNAPPADIEIILFDRIENLVKL